MCVRGTLARVTPLAFRSWPRPRNSASATATQDFHFGISISFCKIAARTNPRPFHFVFASPRGHPAVPCFSCHAVARSIASARVNNKEASPPGTYLIVFFSRVGRPRISMAWCVLAPRSSHRPPRAPDVVRRALGRPVDCRRPIVRLLPVITVTYPRGLSLN